MHSYQQRHYKLLLIILATLRSKKDKLIYNLIETFRTYQLIWFDWIVGFSFLPAPLSNNDVHVFLFPVSVFD